MVFGQALELCKRGSKIRRKSWEDKTFILYQKIQNWWGIDDLHFSTRLYTLDYYAKRYLSE